MPGPQGNELCIEQPLQRDVDFVPAHAESQRHALAPEERGTASVRGEREQHESGRCMRSDLREPSLVQQLRLQPAEGISWPPLQIGPRRDRGRSAAHDDLGFFARSLRSFAFRSARSSASRCR